MPKIKISVILAVLLAIIIIFAVSSLDRIAIYYFAKTHNVNITYTKLPSVRGNPFVYGDMTITDRRTGFGFSSGLATFELRRFGAGGVKFNFQNGHFIGKQIMETVTYNTLTQLVGMPFGKRWVYREISGELIPFHGGAKVKDFLAVSENVRLRFTGDIYDDNTIKADVVIYFSNNLLGEISDEFSKVVLADEKDGWKSLSVHLEGNYKNPSIQISSSRFRLNIKTIVK